MAFLDTLKNAWNKVTDFFTASPTTTATTPTTTTTPTTPTPSTATQVIGNAWTVLPNIQSAETLNSLINWETWAQNVWVQQPTGNAESFYDYWAVDEQKVKDKLKERQEDSESIWDKITSGITWIADFVWWLVKADKMDQKYDKTKKVTNIWYNRDNDNIYTLELADEYQNINWNVISNEQYLNMALNKYYQTVDAAWWYENAPMDVINQAYQQLYNDTKWLFTAKADDWYWSDSWPSRRKSAFSEDQLEYLAKNNVSEWAYTPTPEQFQTFLKNYWANIDLKESLRKEYNITEENSNPFDIDTSQTSRAEGIFMNKAMQWVLELAAQNLEWKQVGRAWANAYTIAKSNFERAYETALPVFEAAAILREKVKQWGTLTKEEQKVLDAANKLDDALNAEADALNFWIKDHMSKDYVWDDWVIWEARDIFSDWRDLHQVISKPVIEALWLEDDEDMSWIDAFQRVSNDALYNYQISAGSMLGNVWEWWQHNIWKIWPILSEVWQQTVYWLSSAASYFDDATNLDFGSIADRLTWRKYDSKIWEYLNQDFTYWMLINTEESWFTSRFWDDFSRLFRKYMYRAAEYVPEAAWNIIPDIILVWASWWTLAVPKIAQRAGSVLKFVNKGSRLMRMNQLYNKLEGADTIRKALGWIRGFEESLRTIARTDDLPMWVRYAWGRAWNLVKNWLIDQAIDAQYNQYDTEAYSTPSFILSTMWTVLTEILPWIHKSWFTKFIKNGISRDYITKGTAWDAIDFLSKEENQNLLKDFTTRFGKNWSLSYDDFRRIGSNMEDLWDILEKSWKAMPDYLKPSVNKWNKELTWRIMNQVYDIDSNSILWRNIRAIISKEWTSLADLYKFVLGIPWDVKIGPWRSIIKLKNADGSFKSLLWIEWWAIKWYDQKLDMILDWWFSNKLKDWFTINEINKIKSLPEYSNLSDTMFTLDKDWKYYITKEWVDALWISTMELPVELQARELAKAEAWEISEKFRTLMKNISDPSRKNIKNATIDAIADSWTYQDVRQKVADVVC